MRRDITTGHIQRILINPFYAIQITPQLVIFHIPSIGDEEWVNINASLMQEKGVKQWLTLLLNLLQGKINSEEQSFNPYNAINIDPMYAVEHPPLLSVEEWIQSNVKLIEEMGKERWLRLFLDVLEGDFVTSEEMSGTALSPGTSHSQFRGKKCRKQRRKKEKR
jgi:hypothetical protein